MPPPASAGFTSTGKPKLTQLAGFRTCASLWLVLGHFMGVPRIPGGALINRGPVAVEGFILLSGYVTHYAYASKQYNSATAILRYYARRFGAVLFSYYATWLVMLILSIGACASGACISNDHMLNPVYSITRGALSLLMLQSFEPTEPYFPNGPAWTISTMGLLWLLYPFLRKLLQRPLAQRPLLLCVCACACTQMPIWAAFVATAGGVQVPPAEGEGPPTVERFYMTERMYLWLYHFPVFRLGDFTMGMALAELASAATSAGADNAAQALRRPIGWRGWGRASDACFMVLWVLCAFIPADPRSTSIDAHSGYEPLFVGAMQPLLAGFMLFSTLDTTGLSHSARIMRHPIMSGLGEYSFQVYLWHWPLGMLFKGAEIGLTGNTSRGFAGPMLVSYLLATWLLAAAVSIHAEEPFRKWLRVRVDGWADRAERQRADGATKPAGGSDGGGAASAAPAGASSSLLPSGAERSDAPTYSRTNGAEEARGTVVPPV